MPDLDLRTIEALRLEAERWHQSENSPVIRASISLILRWLGVVKARVEWDAKERASADR
jgi:hypothetical protein